MARPLGQTGLWKGAGSWKVAGIAFGTAAVVATSTAAYACLPGTGGTTTAPRTVTMTSVAEFDDHVGTAVTEHVLSELSELVALVRVKVATIGTPSTLTPRQAWKIKHTIALVGFLQAKLAALPATDAAKADALATSLATLKSRLASVLANATVVAPTTVTHKSLRLRPSFADFSRLGTRNFCDHSGDRTFWRYRHHDGDRR